MEHGYCSGGGCVVEGNVFLGIQGPRFVHRDRLCSFEEKDLV